MSVVAVIAVAHAWMIPQVVEQGRAIDFVPRPEDGPKPPEVQHFIRLHVVYVIADLVKAIAAFGTIPLLWLSARAASLREGSHPSPPPTHSSASS